jgi:hypothetical protein
MLAESVGVLLPDPGSRTGRHALDVIRVLGRNGWLGLRPDHKLGDNTKRRRGAFQRLSITNGAQVVRHRGHEVEGRGTRTKNMSGLSASLARVMVLFASTTSTSRTWSSAEPQRRDRGPRPPIVACPVQGGQFIHDLIYDVFRKCACSEKVPPIPTWMK